MSNSIFNLSRFSLSVINALKIFLFIFVLVVFVVFYTVGHEIPVWYFRLTTFSWDEAVTLQTRQAACAQLQAPLGRTRLSDLLTIFPAAFLENKHFFEVYYSPVLKQCVYAGVDVFSASGKSQPYQFEYGVLPQDSRMLTSTVSFYIASPYLKDCSISHGWCTGIGRGRRGASVLPDRSIKYSRIPSSFLIRTPLPVQAPISADEMFTFFYVGTSGEPRFYEQHRYGAAGFFHRYAAVYDKYEEVVRDYLVR